jgi:hypothetical protein
MSFLKQSLVLAIALAVNGMAQRPQLRPEERQALLDLYKATDGDHWKQKKGWGTAASPCDWYGVGCAGVMGSELRVVQWLDLDDNNLRGSLPASVRAFSHLKVLNIARNHLSGPVPEEQLQRWDNKDFEFNGMAIRSRT